MLADASVGSEDLSAANFKVQIDQYSFCQGCRGSSMGANDYWLSWPSVMKDMQKVGWKHSETHIGPSEASEVVDLAACHPKDLTVQRVMVHLSFQLYIYTIIINIYII